MLRPAWAQAVLDANAVPGLSAKGQAAYADFLLSNLPRTFAIGPGGRFGWQGGTGTAEAARTRALRLGNRALHALLTMSLVAVEDHLAKLEEDYARTQPQVEALKRLVGAT